MKENREKNAVKTEDTSAKEKKSRKITDDDADQVSGGADKVDHIKAGSFQYNPIRPTD